MQKDDQTEHIAEQKDLKEKGEKKTRRHIGRYILLGLCALLLILLGIGLFGYFRQRSTFRSYRDMEIQISTTHKLDIVGLMDSFGVPYSPSVDRSFVTEINEALQAEGKLGSSLDMYNLYANKTWQLDGVFSNGVTLGEFTALQNFSIDFVRHKFPDRVKHGLTYACPAGKEEQTVYDYVKELEHPVILYSCSANDLFYYFATSLEGLNPAKIWRILTHLGDAAELLEEHVRKNIETLHECNPDAVILVMGLYMPSDQFFLNRFGNMAIRKFNRRIEATCEGRERVHYVDVTSVAFGILEGDFHPDQEGQHVLAALLTEAVNRYCDEEFASLPETSARKPAEDKEGEKEVKPGENREDTDAAVNRAEKLYQTVLAQAHPTEDYVQCAVALEDALLSLGWDTLPWQEIARMKTYLVEHFPEEEGDKWSRAYDVEIADKHMLSGIRETDNALDPEGVKNDKLSLLNEEN